MFQNKLQIEEKQLQVCAQFSVKFHCSCNNLKDGSFFCFNRVKKQVVRQMKRMCVAVQHKLNPSLNLCIHAGKILLP